MLIFFIVYFIYLTLGDLVSYLMNLCCAKFVLEDLEINEDIDSYQNCLDEDDKQYTEKEEMNMRNFGLQAIFTDTLQQLKAAKMREGMHL